MTIRSHVRLIGLGIVIVIVHTLLLFLVIPEVSGHLGPSYNQNRFTDGYDQLAANLVAGNGYRFYPDTARTLMREPGYPLLLSGLLLAGGGFATVKFANMILALLTAWLTIVLARRLTLDSHASRLFLLLAPPLLFLFHPATLIAESRGGVEIVFAFLCTLFLLTVFVALETNRWWSFAISGIVLGITVSFRSTPMLFPLFLFPYCLLFQRHRISALAVTRNLAVMVIAMLIVLSPWTIRNYSLTGSFVPTASVLGVSAQAGQYIGTHLFEGRPWWLLDREAARERSRLALRLGYQFKEGGEGYYQTFLKSQDEVSFSHYLFNAVKAEYLRSPLLFVRCVGQNVFNFWFAGKTWTATALNAVVQLPYLVLAFVGAIRGLKSTKARFVALALWFIAYIMAIHAPILAQARYSVPLIPLLSVLAAIGLITTRRRVRMGMDVPAIATSEVMSS